MIRQCYGIPNDVEFGEEFMSRFPILFQERKKSMQETCMCWGIECPIGWYHILEQLCTILEFHNLRFRDEYGIAVVADQVKEKFGTLRFYYTVRKVDRVGLVHDNGDDGISSESKIAMDYLEMLADKYIDEAETLTAKTCAECGIPLDKNNKVETQGWITYICKECNAKREEEYLKRTEQKTDEEADKAFLDEHAETTNILVGQADELLEKSPPHG